MMDVSLRATKLEHTFPSLLKNENKNKTAIYVQWQTWW